MGGASVCALLLAGCGGGAGDAETMSAAGDAVAPAVAAAPIQVADVGFATPESVVHDEAADLYLVSNINGSPTDKDGNGFISRISPNGNVVELKWIDGEAADVTLHAPKGMAFSGGRLYVADIDCIRIFDQARGIPAGEVCVEGASFLNDVGAALNGGVLFTDSGLDPSFASSGTDAVYRLDGNDVITVTKNPGLGAPNGVIDTNDGPLVVTFMSGEVFRVGIAGNRTVLAGPGQMQLDGVVMLADRRVLMSSWGDSCIYEMSAAGEMECIISGVPAPADIGADVGRNRVLIPLFNDNAVLIQSVP